MLSAQQGSDYNFSATSFLRGLVPKDGAIIKTSPNSAIIAFVSSMNRSQSTNKLTAKYFKKNSNRNPPSERDNSNNSSRSIASGSEVHEVPYHYLLKRQLSRVHPPLKGDFGMNEHCTFFYNGIPCTFDLSNDCHTFMVWSLTHTLSGKDNEEVLLAKYLELEQELVDVRLEWNDDGEITLYQNLPIFLVQEDCLGEFQAVLSRFMTERSNVSAALRRAGCPERSFEKKTSGLKSMSLRKIFGGRSA